MTMVVSLSGASAAHSCDPEYDFQAVSFGLITDWPTHSGQERERERERLI